MLQLAGRLFSLAESLKLANDADRIISGLNLKKLPARQLRRVVEAQRKNNLALCMEIGPLIESLELLAPQLTAAACRPSSETPTGVN